MFVLYIGGRIHSNRSSTPTAVTQHHRPIPTACRVPNCVFMFFLLYSLENQRNEFLLPRYGSLPLHTYRKTYNSFCDI